MLGLTGIGHPSTRLEPSSDGDACARTSLLELGVLRAPVDTIPAPLFPRDMAWLNVASLRMEKQRGRPVLVEFWDCCRVQSLRTLDYVRAWHERYEEAGLRVISIHAPGFPPSRDVEVVRETVERHGVEHAVLLDQDYVVWKLFENRGWPARYLFNPMLRLHSYHYGEGGYDETEREIQELLGVSGPVMDPVRPEDAPAAAIVVPTSEQQGAYSGPYEAGGVWVVTSGAGEVRSGSVAIEVGYDGAHELVAHDRHTEGVLAIEASEGVVVHATCFTPGLAA